MKKRGIGFRIITMAVVISAISAIIGVIGLYTTKKSSRLTIAMYEKDLLGVQYAKEMNYLLQSSLSQLMIANRPGKTNDQIADGKKVFEQICSSFSEAVKNYEPTESSEQEKILITQIRADSADFAQKGLAMYDFSLKGDIQGANRYIDTILAPINSKKLVPAIDQLVKISTTSAVAEYKESKRIVSLSITVIIAAILIGLTVSLILGITITRSITKPVSKVVNSLSESSSQIRISSTQLSSASQEIANGAQEQASSIEETTSSMEELSSMVRQNLGNTRQASLLSEKATDASQNGFDKMTSMLTAMTNISKSAEDIKNVIDVIDDIAFQTNMLALNAAVEAARAGEAGMGFAVVADEVKNLANRSSESAKETASMIKETLRNVEDGVTMSKDLAEIFKDILGNSKKVQEMNKEVETASGQQDEGIGQVNKVLIQFDTVVQTNASSAEETAGAAEELQGQVGSLNEIVDSLYLIVSGKTYSGGTGESGSRPAAEKHEKAASGPAARQAEMKAAPAHGTALKAQPSVKKGCAPGETAEQKSGPVKKETKHVISFEDDEDFKPV
ncbi:MAG: methyl-accepting chemotaxis protein [Treponema sp.]|nr:methyl-accepting chemotaxis protein [Treponema sp.]